MATKIDVGGQGVQGSEVNLRGITYWLRGYLGGTIPAQEVIKHAVDAGLTQDEVVKLMEIAASPEMKQKYGLQGAPTDEREAALFDTALESLIDTEIVKPRALVTNPDLKANPVKKPGTKPTSEWTFNDWLPWEDRALKEEETAGFGTDERGLWQEYLRRTNPDFDKLGGWGQELQMRRAEPMYYQYALRGPQETGEGVQQLYSDYFQEPGSESRYTQAAARSRLNELAGMTPEAFAGMGFNEDQTDLQQAAQWAYLSGKASPFKRAGQRRWEDFMRGYQDETTASQKQGNAPRSWLGYYSQNKGKLGW